MRLRYLYQTLDDRSNPEEIENNGPYKCNRKNAWLGCGYYFWDSNLEAAHWWGKDYKDGYVICRSQYDYDSLDYLDLVGNTEHLDSFKLIANEIANKIKKSPTVPMVIEQLKILTNFSKLYKAIRAHPINSKNNEEDKIFFIDTHTAYINLNPPIQMCVLNKSFLIKNIFDIIYPEIYCKESLV
jgi:hypothetical protein